MGGTNAGDGSIDDVDIEDDLASSLEDALPNVEEPPYAGRSGGAVGGAPAEKRATGGQTHGGFVPDSPGDDPTIGRNPPRKRPKPR
jgi:hypothetical protein